MKTAEFFQRMDGRSDRPVRFRDHLGELVHPSYHVSEVKSASWQTVDCGGMVHTWNETVLQLWISGDPDSERAMTAGTLTGIAVKVSQLIDLDPEAEVRVEYGNSQFPPVLFHVENLEEEGEALVVGLKPPALECKLESRGGSCARPDTAGAADVGASPDTCCSGKTGCC
jgi:hypothetical protein